MRKSKMLAKWRAGKPAKIAMMGFYLPPFIAYCAHAGYDGIWLDLEHRPMDTREVQALLGFFHLYDIDCMVRPATREKAQLYRYLEDGATGFIVPHVNDVESARQLVQSVKFPPIGDRGLEGRGLEGNFGLDTLQSRAVLAEHAKRETFVLAQIETMSALNSVEAMAQIEGLDGLYVGPSDLSLRLPYEPEATRPTLEQALERVATACQANGKVWGCLAKNLDEVRQHQALGAQVQVWGTDIRMLIEGVAQAGRDWDAVAES